MNSGFAQQELPSGNIVIYSPEGSSRAFVLTGLSKEIFRNLKADKTLEVFPRGPLTTVLKLFVAENLVTPSELVDKGICEATQWELGLDGIASKPPTEKLSGLSFWIHATNKCNLRCNYCYATKGVKLLTTEISDRFVNTLLNDCRSQKINFVRLKFAGGEPLLALDEVVYLANETTRILSKEGVEVDLNIISNGTLMSRKTVQSLVSNGFTNIMISLDGIEEWNRNRTFRNGKDSFRAVRRGISNLIDAGIKPNILSVLTNDNAAGMHLLWDYSVENDLHVSLNPSRDYDIKLGKPKLDLKLMKTVFLPQVRRIIESPPTRRPNITFMGVTFFGKRKAVCGAGFNYFGLTPTGCISTCQMTIDNPIGSLFNNMSIAKLSSCQPPMPSRCSTCLWRDICFGGCKVLSSTAGRLNQPSVLCELLQELFPLFLIIEGQKIERKINLIE